MTCIAWSGNSEYIASGGEDTRYKIWDMQGTNIYTSTPDDYPITAVDFSPNDGNYLATCGFNMVKLCHSTGVSYFVKGNISLLYYFFLQWCHSVNRL